MRFEVNRQKADDPYTFALVGDDDATLLIGRAQASRDECLAAIRAAIARLDEPGSFVQREEGGEFYCILRSAEGEELARSRPLASSKSAAALAAAIVGEAREMSRYEVVLAETSRVEGAEAVRLPRIASARVDPVSRYDFARVSTAGAGVFEPFERQDGKFSFHFNDAEGNALLYCREFASASERDRRIRAVIRSAAAAARYERRQENGRWFFILEARNGREIARSRSFDSAERMESAIAYLMETAPRSRGLFGAAKRSRDLRNQYNLERASISGMAGFETFRAEDGSYYFHFNDEDGRALLYSQAYSAAAGRDNGVRAVIKNAGVDARYEERQENGGYYFVLKAANWAEIGRSRTFDSRADMASALAYLKTAGVSYAAAFGVQLAATESTTRETITLGVDRERPPPAAVSMPPVPVAVPPGAAETPPAEPEPPAAAVPPPAETEPPAAAETPPAETEPPAAAVPPPAAPEPPAAAMPPPAAPEPPAAAVPPPTEPQPPATAAPPLAVSQPPAGETPRAAPSAPEPQRPEREPASERRQDKQGWPWWMWPLLLLLLLLLLLFLVRGCRDQATPAEVVGETVQPVPPASPQPAEVAGETVKPAPPASPQPAEVASETAEPDAPPPGEDATGAAPGRRDEPNPRGPGAEELGFANGTFAAGIADFLSRPDSEPPHTFIMDKVLYSFNSARLNHEAYEQVDSLARVLTAHPTTRIELRGHIETSESDTYIGPAADGRITLSEVRARCIYKKLIERGIAGERMSFRGMGAEHNHRRQEVVVTEL